VQLLLVPSPSFLAASSHIPSSSTLLFPTLFSLLLVLPLVSSPTSFIRQSSSATQDQPSFKQAMPIHS
jgi:hypothetical protein